MKKNLAKIISEIDLLVEESGETQFEILDELKKYYFKKLLTINIRLYKKRTKKVKRITRDLRISQRVFYSILEEKGIPFKKYNKNKENTELIEGAENTEIKPTEA